MNLDALRLYCDVVRLKSFSRAAAAGGVSQSAASQAIRQLEAELDATLLDRTRRPLEPTLEGRGFYEACRGLLAGFDKARADLAASRQRVEGTVRVAAIYSVGLHDMSRHMQPFSAAYPHARVLLECLHPHKVVEAVLNDEADLGILSYPPANRALQVLTVREEPMVVVTHPSHRLARRRRVVPADLDGERFVAFDHDLPIRRAIDRALKQQGVRVDVAMEFDNVETIKQAIGIAAGVSILPAPTVQKESEMKTLAVVDLALPGLVRPVAIIHRRGRHLTAAVSRFIAKLRENDARGGARRSASA
jgi:DNA-binding transcriptional LysR family regulator